MHIANGESECEARAWARARARAHVYAAELTRRPIRRPAAVEQQDQASGVGVRPMTKAIKDSYTCGSAMHNIARDGMHHTAAIMHSKISSNTEIFERIPYGPAAQGGVVIDHGVTSSVGVASHGVTNSVSRVNNACKPI